MRFNCGPSAQELRRQEIERKQGWHLWFAWHPVRTGNKRCAWLERVWRRGELCASWGESWWEYEYQLQQGDYYPGGWQEP